MKALFPHSPPTGDVIVRVSVSFLPEQSEPAQGHWFWAYHIRIENGGARPVQLLSREWIISGRARRAQRSARRRGGRRAAGDRAGRGRSIMSRAARSTTPTGAMEGRYFMVGADGARFAVDIPRFPLIAPAVTG